ncbi:MAG: signal peptidase I [Acidimicrobiia bacterium]
MTVVMVVVFGGFLYLRAWPPIVVVMSSSMEPAIDTGAIVLIKHVEGPPKVGDVVKVAVPAEAQAEGYPKEVLHRVIEITEDGLVRTQGDNLDKPDPFALPASAVTQRVVTVIPGAGELIAFLFSPYGLMWMVAGVLLLVVMPFFDGQRELKLAISEYGYHLRSHTEILQSMSVASLELAATTERLRETLATDTQDDSSDEIDIPDWILTSPGPGSPQRYSGGSARPPMRVGTELERGAEDWPYIP